MNEALLLRDLHFGYGRQAAVQNVSLRLMPGDCYGFLGHNGAGKTTVMRLCLGLLRPRSGEIRVFGLDPRQNTRRAHSRMGALIERPGFHNHRSARTNLLALAHLQGIAGRLAAVECERVLDNVGLADAANRRVGTFSMGMRQRLGIAQALLGRPQLLLLDEPSNGLDPEGIADLRALLMRLTRDEGCAVMLSSHQLSELDGVCNRVGVLREGAMVVEGDLATLRRHAGTRHVVTGPSLDALQATLSTLDLQPKREVDRLLVELGSKQPHEVARALATRCELTSFAPEHATLERIYLHASEVAKRSAPQPADIIKADRTQADSAEAESRSRDSTAEPAAEATAADTATATATTPAAGDPGPASPPATPLGRFDRARRRSIAHEFHALCRRPSTLPLLALPSLFAAWSIYTYSGRVQIGLQQVAAGARFSADAGSGYLAVALGLQTAIPALMLVLLWIASQSVATDITTDTLRNTLIRSVRRSDVLLAKVTVNFGATLAAWLICLLTAIIAGSAMLGFGDLEEVSRYGDRDLLAAADSIQPTMLLAFVQLLLPLTAVAMIATAASTIMRRPALALIVAALAVLGPELLRSTLGQHSGWLLTSHLPIGIRDDSIVDYLGATARGAADAVWVSAPLAAYAPLFWIAISAILLKATFSRMRIR